MLRLVKAVLGAKCYHWLADVFLQGRRRVAETFGVYRWSRMGLYEMDKKLSRYLNFEKGVYVEAGANDGVTQSNTYYLSKALGWRGILIEPVYPIYLKCKKIALWIRLLTAHWLRLTTREGNLSFRCMNKVD